MSAPKPILKAKKVTKQKLVQDFVKEALAAGLTMHCTEGMLPYFRRSLKDGGWLPETAEGLRAGYLLLSYV